jgi:hypothetical protein
MRPHPLQCPPAQGTTCAAGATATDRERGRLGRADANLTAGPRRVLVLASLAVVGALVTCGSNLSAGDSCFIGQHIGPVSDDCPPGLACLFVPDGDALCTAATPCNADSDCPSNFGCSAIDFGGGTTFCATSCTTSCGDGYGCPGCVAGYGCAADGVSCELRLGKSCYVTDTSGAGCGTGAACSAITHVCALTPQCSDDSECVDGFACGYKKRAHSPVRRPPR